MNSGIQEIVIALPAYNEERDLPKLLERINQTLPQMPWRWRVVVVDDGSQDRTAEVVRTAALAMPVELVQHEKNQGLGEAIQTGLRTAAKSADVVITMDADNSHDPIYIESMIKELERAKCDVVIASRFRKGSVVSGVPWYRKILSIGCFLTMKVLLPYRNVRDYSAGYRAYRGTTLNRLLQRTQGKPIDETGFVCMLELLLKFRALEATASEVPYTLRYDLKEGASKMKVFRTIRRYISVILKFWGKEVLPPLPVTGEPARSGRSQ